MIPKPLAVAIVCLVTLVWLANFAAQFVVTDYQVDGWVHVIFLSVVGGALGLSKGEDGQPSPIGALVRQFLGGGGPPAAPPPAVPASESTPAAQPPADQPPRAGGAHRALALLPPWRSSWRYVPA